MVGAEAAVSTREENQEAAERLGAALERIARSAARVPEVVKEPDPRLGQIAVRLEALIVALKKALEKGADG